MIRQTANHNTKKSDLRAKEQRVTWCGNGGERAITPDLVDSEPLPGGGSILVEP